MEKVATSVRISDILKDLQEIETKVKEFGYRMDRNVTRRFGWSYINRPSYHDISAVEYKEFVLYHKILVRSLRTMALYYLSAYRGVVTVQFQFDENELTQLEWIFDIGSIEVLRHGDFWWIVKIPDDVNYKIMLQSIRIVDRKVNINKVRCLMHIKRFKEIYKEG